MLHAPDPRPGQAIADVEATILDLPFRRLQRFARLDARAQTIVLVRVRDGEGAEGIGECCVPCGPWWSGDSVESIKALIDAHLAPALIGADPESPAAAMDALDRVAHGARFAKAGVEMALLDLLGRRLGVPVAGLLGGARRHAVPVAWPLASGSDEGDLAEMEQKLAGGEASGFKMKLGATDPAADLARARLISDRLGGRGRLILDPNESWSEAQAVSLLPQLAELDVTLLEQPVRRDLAGAMVRLAARTSIPLLADEGTCTESEALALACAGGAQVLSLKLMKAGGILPSRRMADIAEAGGVVPYLGTFLESSIATAASLHLGAALPALPYGGETVGPMLLAEDVVTRPIAYADGAAHLPGGPGLGVTLNLDTVREFGRGA